MSIERAEFDKVMAEVAEVFSPPDEGQMDIYYRHLARHLPGELRRAATRLIETHTYQRFPLIAEWNDAVTYVIQQTHEPDPDSFDSKKSCGFCANGFVPYTDKDGYTVAGYCVCPKGKALHSRHADYMRRIGRPLRQVEFRRPEGAADAEAQAEALDRSNDLEELLEGAVNDLRLNDINEDLPMDMGEGETYD